MHSSSSDINPYLQHEVLSASGVRLRWMLIKRAEELCGVVGQMWRDGQEAQAGQWIIRVRDILGELLAGVQDASNPIGKNVSDFYVFLLQLLTEVENSRSQQRMNTLRELLGIEAETWRQVVERTVSPVENAPVPPLPALSLDRKSQIPSPIPGSTQAFEAFGFDSLGGSFNLEV